MTRRPTVWLAVAVILLVMNVAGLGVAAAGGELLHAAVHAGLLLPNVYFVRRLAATRYGDSVWNGGRSGISAQSGEFSDRLTRLEQSLDAAAIEIERVGEGQRFMTRIFAENRPSQTPADAPGRPDRHQGTGG